MRGGVTGGRLSGCECTQVGVWAGYPAVVIRVGAASVVSVVVYWNKPPSSLRRVRASSRSCETRRRLAFGLFVASSLTTACVDEPGAAGPEADDMAMTPRTLAAADLELHWNMESRSGNTVFDLSGHGRHGTVIGGSFTPSAWGEALTLDGVDDYVAFTGGRDPADYDGGVTISARVRVTDANRYNTICFGCGPTNMLAAGTSNFGARAYAALAHVTGGKTWPMSTVGSIQDDTWVNLTMVVDEFEGTRFYTDCQLDADVPAAVALHDYSYSSVGQGVNPTSWFQGDIDDLRIWNRPLTEAELAEVCEEPVDLPCGGAPEAAALGIGLPTPPQSYFHPPCDEPGVLCVTPETIGTLYNTSAPRVVFADGVYDVDDIPGNYLVARGQILEADNVGQAVLRFGIEVGGNGAAFADTRVRGFVFDIEDRDALPPAAGTAAGQAAVRAWGDATGLRVEDVVIRGNGLADTGVSAYSPDGLVVERSEIMDVRRYGVWAVGNGAIATPVELRDLNIHGVHDPEVDPDGPTTQAGIQMGEPGVVSHVRVRDVGRAGVNVYANADDTVVEYVDVDQVSDGDPSTGSVGIYLENQNRNTVVQNFCVGPQAEVGVNAEWDHYCPPGSPPTCNEAGGAVIVRSIEPTVRDGLIEAANVGVAYNSGTVTGLVEDTIFRGYRDAAIVFHDNSMSEASWPAYDDDSSTQSGNDFQTMGCALSYQHWSTSFPPPPIQGGGIPGCEITVY